VFLFFSIPLRALFAARDRRVSLITSGLFSLASLFKFRGDRRGTAAFPLLSWKNCERCGPGKTLLRDCAAVPGRWGSSLAQFWVSRLSSLEFRLKMWGIKYSGIKSVELADCSKEKLLARVRSWCEKRVDSVRRE